MVDTSGYTPLTGTVRRIVELTDLFLLDVKSVNDDMHRIIIGESNERNIAFAEYLAEAGRPVRVRCVMVPNLNDREHCPHKLAQWWVKLGNIEQIEILPFHKMGEWKWKEIRPAVSPCPNR